MAIFSKNAWFLWYSTSGAPQVPSNKFIFASFKQKRRFFLEERLPETMRLILNYQPGVNTRSEGCPRGVMVKAMDCGIVVSEFVLQSRYYDHFRANTVILPAMG